MTIKVYLQAGLGNQLFMIFALVSYAFDHGINYMIKSHLNNTMNGTKTYWNTILDSFQDKIYENNEIETEYLEPSFDYNKLPDTLASSEYIIKGFFQSYKYFEHNYEKILEIMNLKKKINDVKNEYGYLIKEKTIALHFRIGDYVGLQNYHCIKGPEYYINALRALDNELKIKGENIQEYTILYFCQTHDKYCVDQMLNIIQNMNYFNYKFVAVPDDIEDWKQMLLMSLCDHFIIANSTFSWFGAYLCEKKDKLVCYPQIWFGPALAGTHNIKDLCPLSWKAII